MCDPHGTDAGEFPDPATAATAATASSRRTLLKVGGAAGAGLVFSTAVGAQAATLRDPRRAYVFVLDGLRPGEIDSGLMPTIKGLRDGGTSYPRARSLPIAETIPNHVMMMTGVRPARNGIPANEIYDRAAGEIRKMDRPTDIRTRTIIEQLNASGRRTGTALSKTYLYTVFGDRPTHRWEPGPIVPISGHAPDRNTMDATVAMVRNFDPHLVFVNLGSIDRSGHVDVGGEPGLIRRGALQRADAEVKRFVDLLRSTGRWKNSLLVFLADHSMDWSDGWNTITLTHPFNQDPFLKGRFTIADNGGADLVYWTGPARDRAEGVSRMVRIAQQTRGVLSAYDRAATPSLQLSANAGDVVVYCKAGWRFSDPGPLDNPIVGNHGHPATFPIPFFLTGGHPRVARRASRTAIAHTMDVAPTLGDFFGVRAPASGWQGRTRL